MASSVRTRPVEDSIPKVGNELAVGEDLQFQSRWWKFERMVWIVFALILAADLAGVFGRGPLAKASVQTADGTMKIEYDRVERFQTPAILTVKFGPQAVRNGKIQLWVSENVIRPLGNQRIIPAPETSVIEHDGMLYTWPSSPNPDGVSFALEPSVPGTQTFTVRLPVTGDEIRRRIIVMP